MKYPTSETLVLALEPNSVDLAAVVPWACLRVSREGTILLVNESTQRLMNRHAKEMEGASILDFFMNDDEKLSIPDLLSLLMPEKSWQGAWVAIAGERRFVIDVMVRVDPQDSNSVWIVALENPVINDQVLVSNRTELRLLQSLLDNTLDYIFLLDTHGHFMITNRAFRKVIDVPYAGYEIGKRLGDFVVDETRRQFAVTDQRVLETGKPLVNHINHLRLKKGGGIWIQTTKVPVFNVQGECIGLACVSRDITELKETTKRMRQVMRRAEIANQTKSEFLANMSHEIRTPINGILGMTELCLSTALNDEQKEYLDAVMACSHNLLKIVNDILDFSKIQSGHLNIECVDFHLHEWLEEVIAFLKPSAEQKNLELCLEISPHVEGDSCGDPVRLRQVLYNLITNAIKFTEQGRITVRVENTGHAYPECNLRITVSDTGIGIPVSRQDDIFNSFTQADSSTTRKYGGTGLGLAICRRIVEMMGGLIDVESAVGEGSTFTVEIPIKRACQNSDLEIETQDTMVLKSPTVDIQKMNILVLAQGKVGSAVLVPQLERLGHHVEWVETIDAARAFITQSAWDIVFTDIELLEDTGFRVVDFLRKYEQKMEAEATPVIAVRGYADKDYRYECRQSKVNLSVAKPLTAPLLAEILQGFALVSPNKVSGFSALERNPVNSFSRFMSTSDPSLRQILMAAGSIYLDTYKEQLLMLKAALENGEPCEITQCAHRIQSDVGALGDWECEVLAFEIKQSLTDVEPRLLMPVFEALSARMEGLASEVNYWINSSRTPKSAMSPAGIEPELPFQSQSSTIA